MSKKHNKEKPIWKADPEEHDYPAAIEYLSLLFDDATVKKLVDKLRNATTVSRKSRDILRASGLPLLKAKDLDVRDNLKNIENGKLFSPVLLISYEGKLIIPDGYTRCCSMYYTKYSLDIPSRLINFK